jgi:hypothetical protein
VFDFSANSLWYWLMAGRALRSVVNGGHQNILAAYAWQQKKLEAWKMREEPHCNHQSTR